MGGRVGACPTPLADIMRKKRIAKAWVAHRKTQKNGPVERPQRKLGLFSARQWETRRTIRGGAQHS